MSVLLGMGGVCMCVTDFDFLSLNSFYESLTTKGTKNCLCLCRFGLNHLPTMHTWVPKDGILNRHI